MKYNHNSYFYAHTCAHTYIAILSMFSTADCGKRVLLGIFFYNYFDNYYFSFCTRTVTCWYGHVLVQTHFFSFCTSTVT